jgi:hypothetical protein
MPLFFTSRVPWSCQTLKESSSSSIWSALVGYNTHEGPKKVGEREGEESGLLCQKRSVTLQKKKNSTRDQEGAYGVLIAGS